MPCLFLVPDPELVEHASAAAGADDHAVIGGLANVLPGAAVRLQHLRDALREKQTGSAQQLLTLQDAYRVRVLWGYSTSSDLQMALTRTRFPECRCPLWCRRVHSRSAALFEGVHTSTRLSHSL